MDLETQLGWAIILILGMAVVFYTLGYSTGKRDGHKAGRAVGIRIGERRAREAVGK
jgi:hypothetical protein